MGHKLNEETFTTEINLLIDEYLRENLTVDVSSDYSDYYSEGFKVKLMLKGETISTGYYTLSFRK